jgi:hypothetical protein
VNDAWLLAAAGELAGERVRAIDVVRGGGNNRVYRVSGTVRDYALKRYPDDPQDACDRYEREFGALSFLWNAGEHRVPEPIALDAPRGLALYEWIDGVRIEDRTAADLDALAGFMGALHRLRRHPGADRLGFAREAVLSQAQLIGQLHRRIDRLRADAVPFVGLDELVDAIEGLIAATPPAPGGELDRDRQTLSPSDFGLHNALRAPAGLRFLDFEYFGWDDPVKLVADVLWHPGMSLDAAERQRLFDGAADVYNVDGTFLGRFDRDAPLYGLRWALIVLNEFLPAMWRRRVTAGGSSPLPAALRRQFEKATGLVERVRTGGPLS